jgi:hypothetical protein
MQIEAVSAEKSKIDLRDLMGLLIVQIDGGLSSRGI